MSGDIATACSFCGRPEAEAGPLVSGRTPGVAICHQCASVIAQRNEGQPPAAGHRLWYIPDGYLPPTSAPGGYVSHESVCVLNTGLRDATVHLTLYFEHQEPLRDITNVIPAERTLHIRLDRPEFTGGHHLPRGVPYAIRAESDEPIVVQHSRLDATQPALALFTTLGFPDRAS